MLSSSTSFLERRLQESGSWLVEKSHSLSIMWLACLSATFFFLKVVEAWAGSLQEKPGSCSTDGRLAGRKDANTATLNNSSTLLSSAPSRTFYFLGSILLLKGRMPASSSSVSSLKPNQPPFSGYPLFWMRTFGWSAQQMVLCVEQRLRPGSDRTLLSGHGMLQRDPEAHRSGWSGSWWDWAPGTPWR